MAEKFILNSEIEIPNSSIVYKKGQVINTIDGAINSSLEISTNVYYSIN